jgi:hypothetical protein
MDAPCLCQAQRQGVIISLSPQWITPSNCNRFQHHAPHQTGCIPPQRAAAEKKLSLRRFLSRKKAAKSPLKEN